MSPDQIRHHLVSVIDSEVASRPKLLSKVETMLWLLFPHGIAPRDYGSVVLAVRVLDSLCQVLNTNNALADSDTGSDIFIEVDAAEEWDAAAAQEQRGPAAILVGDDRVGHRTGCSAQKPASEQLDGVVQTFVEDRTEPVAPRAIRAERECQAKPWRNIGSFKLSDLVSPDYSF